MKTNLRLLAFLLTAFVFTSFDRAVVTHTGILTANDSSRESLLKAVREEPKVKEALVTDAKVLYVAVLDDGTRRDGYARYLCELVREHDITVVRVKVVKFGSTKDPKKDNAYGVLLGESFCK